jgi:hypothetical protein
MQDPIGGRRRRKESLNVTDYRHSALSFLSDVVMKCEV